MEPMILPLRCVPVKGRKGAHKGIYARQNNNKPIGTVVTYVGDWPDREAAAKGRAHWLEGELHLRCAEEVIEYARTVYRDWVEALMSVADKLDGRNKHYQLRRFALQGIGALREPWGAQSK